MLEENNKIPWLKNKDTFSYRDENVETSLYKDVTTFKKLVFLRFDLVT